MPKEALLRKVLLTNAIVSGLTGLIVFLFPDAVDRLIGSDAPVVVRIVGGGLVLFAAAVYATGRADGARLRSGAWTIMILDVVWVAASVAAVISGWFSTAGNVVVLAVAAVVGGFAVGEAVGLRRLSNSVENQPVDSYSR